MLKKTDKAALDFATVKIIVCYTEGLAFEKLKTCLLVNDEDIKSASRFKMEKDKVSHLISAHFKRKYIGEWFFNEFNKPQSENAFFNVSHCNGATVIAISDADVGVDVENVRPTERDLIEYVCSVSELPFISSDEDFFRLWTAKESLVKAEGKGLKKDVKSIPAFPFDGEKEYGAEKYFSKQFKDGDFIITVVKKGEKPFTLNIDKENFK